MEPPIKQGATFKTILLMMDTDGKIPWTTSSTKQRKVLIDNMLCHSEACGYSVSTCVECGNQVIHYGSCNNSCCLECGMVKREKWIDRQRQKIVNSSAFHVIFTVPSQLHDLFLANPEQMHKILFASQAEALKKISKDPKYWGAEKIGFFSTEHTWGSTLVFHPHIHTLIYTAGLDKEGNLVFPKGCVKRKKRADGKKKGFLFPAKKVAALFKEIFLKEVCKLFEYSGSPWLNDINLSKTIQWNVEICDELRKPDTVINYLSRYVARLAISNGRIVSYDGETVTFKYKSYRDGGKIKTMSLKDTEFLRRFIQHIPLPHFCRIRHFGWLGNAGKETLKKVQELTGTPEPAPSRTTEEILREKVGENFNTCTKCKGEMVVEHEEFKPKWTPFLVNSFLSALEKPYHSETRKESIKD